MVTLVKVGRVVVLAVLAMFAISAVVGIARPETGPVEKVALAVVFVLVFLGSIVVNRISD